MLARTCCSQSLLPSGTGMSKFIAGNVDSRSGNVDVNRWNVHVRRGHET